MAENNPFPGENNTGHVWDENLRELSNPPPKWWMIALWASLAWFVGYGFLYPMWPIGQEPTQGLLGWSQMDEYNEAVAEVEKMRAPYENKIAGMNAAAILEDSELQEYIQRSAKVLFGDNCAACHGAGGAGNIAFPVLADDNWLYGGQIDTIMQSINNGRAGVMTAHAKILSDEEINTLAQYTLTLSQGKDDPAGKTLFQQKGCIACHGMDAKGMHALGSANLTDGIWRFLPEAGETQLDSAEYTIRHGVNDPNDPQTREAQMPAFKDRLDDSDVKKLAVYVHTLGGGQ